jgi:hypothetical protein
MTHTTSTTHRTGPQRSRRRPDGEGATATRPARRGAASSALRVRGPERQPAEASHTPASTAPADAMRRALAPTPASGDELAALWAMTAAERVEAMWRGELSLAQLCKWSSRRPDEVPLISGEFAWIVIRTPAWADADGGAQTAPGTEGTP